jgi:hypothetical protein
MHAPPLHPQYIGMDVTSLLSVPVWIMEPVTILQKASEIMQYTELLDKASESADKFERWVLIRSDLWYMCVCRAHTTGSVLNTARRL